MAWCGGCGCGGLAKPWCCCCCCCVGDDDDDDDGEQAIEVVCAKKKNSCVCDVCFYMVCESESECVLCARARGGSSNRDAVYTQVVMWQTEKRELTRIYRAAAGGGGGERGQLSVHREGSWRERFQGFTFTSRVKREKKGLLKNCVRWCARLWEGSSFPVRQEHFKISLSCPCSSCRFCFRSCVA